MGAYLNKYHVAIDSQGYILARSKNNQQFYQKKPAPHFVNKFGSGDSSYRDATFWQFLAQTNWRNGSQQIKFDDAGKFWKSENVYTSELEKLTLSHKCVFAGQLASGLKVNVLKAWRAAQSWWNTNYGYRQQLTITADAAYAAPSGYPVKITIDTAALQTASKVRSDRNDWRVVYWNGSSLVELFRDYISASVTFFSLQAAITAGQSDSNYYIYYGYASESTSKQPTVDTEWNQAYAMFGTTPDANSKAIYHMREGSGTALADDKGANDGTITGATWATAGLLGRYLDFEGTDDWVDCSNGSDFDLGSFTLEGWFWLDNTGNRNLLGKWGATDTTKAYELFVNDKLKGYIANGAGVEENVTGSTTLSTGKWYHLAFSYDGAGDERLFVDGVLETETAGSLSITPGSIANSFYIGGQASTTQDFDGQAQHIRVSNVLRTSFPYAIPAANQPTVSGGEEITTQPPASSFDLYAGGDNGKMYKWDGATTWTEKFDCRRMEWYSTGGDGDLIVGDVAGVETAQAQGFKTDQDVTIKSVELYLKKNAGTPGDITVRIETDNAGKPSGTLVNATATTTITAFVTTDYAWKEAVFTTVFSLTGATQYHIVLKTAAAANDQNYAWQEDGSSPTYSDGSNNHSEDGGTTWTIDASSDLYFKLKTGTTHINCVLVTSVGGTTKMLVGTGDPTSETNGDARIYSFDGTNWVLQYAFDTSVSAQVLSLGEFNDAGTPKVFAGVGPQARIYVSTDLSTWTLSTDINVPQNPGYIWFLKEYNSYLYAGGGSPEFMPIDYYNGFLYYYDTARWNSLYPFDFSVLRCGDFYDAYLFLGTYHGHLFVYDTASLSPIFNFKDLFNYRVSILALKYFDDKLYMALYPQAESGETNVGVWVYDRHGMTCAFTVSGVTGYRCLETVNNNLMIGTGDDGCVYKVDDTQYQASGHVQMSYFDANLPSIDKLYAEVVVKHKPLETGGSVAVHYKFKEADSWTLLGISDTIAAESKIMAFATGVYSKKISLKITLATTDASKTPTLEEVVLKYTLYPTRKWMWTMRLVAKTNCVLLDKTVDTRSAATIRAALEGDIAQNQLIAFTDVDGTEYTCLFHQLDESSWVIDQANANENSVAVTLLES